VKNCKNRLSVGGSAPEPLFASGGWGLRPQTPELLLQQMFCFCFFRTFAPIF